MRFNSLSQFKVTGNFRMLAAALGNCQESCFATSGHKGSQLSQVSPPRDGKRSQLFCEILWAEQVT